ncbi:glycosyltransferase [Trichococcus flocculiformis]|uniref:glycosyltransferase n=1 Tax=Trichococcus flocculiformis TaxID=82803 RepID=UPI002AAB8001|nr:glycosyltransferase [Trichococcus flocculiformis]
MDNQYIAFYASSHGFGHMTRCLAIIEELLETTDHLIYLASGTYQNSFARVYLARFGDRVTYRDIRTEVGLVNKENSLQVDIPRLEHELTGFMAEWDTAVAAEVTILRDLPVACVISDISAIGIQVGDQLGVRNIGIANFTWCEQYEFLGLSDTLIERFREVYAKLDLFIEYDLMLPAPKLHVPRKQIGFICRRFDTNRIAAIKAQYGTSIFITCGKSASLLNIQIDNYDGTIFATNGINITATGNATVIELPIDTFDTHNYLAASDIVIAKAGWGTISEALLSKRNLVLIDREGVLEDTENIEELKRRGIAVSIKEADLARIDMQAITNLIADNIIRENLDAYENALEDIIREL